MGQECPIDGQSIRRCKMAEREFGEVEWQTGMDTGPGKSGVRGCVNDRVVWDVYWVKSSGKLAGAIQFFRNSSVGKFSSDESIGVIRGSDKTFMGVIVYR